MFGKLIFFIFSFDMFVSGTPVPASGDNSEIFERISGRFRLRIDSQCISATSGVSQCNDGDLNQYFEIVKKQRLGNRNSEKCLQNMKSGFKFVDCSYSDYQVFQYQGWRANSTMFVNQDGQCLDINSENKRSPCQQKNSGQFFIIEYLDRDSNTVKPVFNITVQDSSSSTEEKTEENEFNSDTEEIGTITRFPYQFRLRNGQNCISISGDVETCDNLNRDQALRYDQAKRGLYSAYGITILENINGAFQFRDQYHGGETQIFTINGWGNSTVLLSQGDFCFDVNAINHKSLCSDRNDGQYLIIEFWDGLSNSYIPYLGGISTTIEETIETDVELPKLFTIGINGLCLAIDQISYAPILKECDSLYNSLIFYYDKESKSVRNYFYNTCLEFGSDSLLFDSCTSSESQKFNIKKGGSSIFNIYQQNECLDIFTEKYRSTCDSRVSSQQLSLTSAYS
jgi:hypothetical protein